MANYKIQLKKNNGDKLFPAVSINNLFAADYTTKVQVPILDGTGKIDSSYLPSYVDDIIDLIAMQNTAPEHCEAGDKYYNTSVEGDSAKKIFTATATDTWGTTGETPVKDVIYVNTADDKIYRWSGTIMTEISKQVTTTTVVRAAGTADNNAVPTEAAVRTAIDAVIYTLPAATTTSLGGVIIDETASNGVALSITDGTLSVSTGTASTSAYGTIQIATAEEVTAGTVSTKAVVPSTLKTELDKKQTIFTDTTNVSISGTSIAVADAGSGTKGVVTVNAATDMSTVSTSGSSIDYNNVPCTYAVAAGLEAKQDALTADDNFVSINSGNTITTVLQYDVLTDD